LSENSGISEILYVITAKKFTIFGMSYNILNTVLYLHTYKKSTTSKNTLNSKLPKIIGFN
jgi:hypothetical protein